MRKRSKELGFLILSIFIVGLQCVSTARASNCDPPPSGIAAWWPGEGNGNDIISGNTATLQSSVSFAPGEVGQAFAMDSFGAYLSVPASASLNVGTNGGLTVEAWINLTNVIGFHPIAEWNNGSGVLGCHMWLGTGPSDVGVLLANIIDTNGIYHGIFSPQNAVAANVFQHVAVTYDQASGVATLYVNGTIVAQSTVGSFVPQTSYDFWMGVRAGDTPGDSTYGSFLGGELDELSIYKRALGSNEIAAIYHAGSAGKCFTPTPPVITTQPSNQTVAVGGTVAFSVAATGTPPLDYQWSFDGTNIIGATNATLTLADVQFNQAGNYQVTVSNAVGSTNSTVATLTPLAPLVITQQPQSEMVPSFSSASFTVAASGPGPLSYQWRKNGTNLVDGGNVSGSATTNLILTSVRLSDAGNYDVLVSNPYATTNSAVAVLTVPETVLSLGSTSAVSGSTIVVPVWMNALGVENAVLASVGYDPTKLALQSVTGTNLTPVYTQTNNGYVGFAVVLNPGATFPAGSNEVADLIFTTLPVTNHATVNLTFGDIPTGRQVVDNNFDSLPAAYLGGTVALSPAEYEADVYPRPNGDSQVNIFDWIEEGRMVAGLDVPTNSDEFARADCAPRNRPNGKLTVADWVQAGRYALGLDPLTPVPPASAHTVAEAKPQGGPISSRMLTVASVSAQRGQTVNVPVLLVCTTNENAVGATIGYNTNLLRFVSATLGASATSGRLNVNTSRLGEVGLALALSPGAAFPPGTNQVAVLQFTTSPSASGTASLALDNTMVQLEVADNTANSLTTAYVNGAIALPDQPALGVKGAGRTLQFSWPLATGTFQVQEANSPTGPWATIMLPLVTNGANVTAACAPTNHQQFFRLEGQ